MKEIIARATLVLLSVSMTIVVIEISLNTACSDTTFAAAHEIFGFFYQPDKEGWRCGEGYKVSIKINSKGFRDREYPYEKPASTRRVLVLGDSFTAAMQVPLETTFHEQIEVLLNQHNRETRYEVISVGVEGWGTSQQLLFFRHEGYKYDPDIVLLMFYIENDVLNNAIGFPDAPVGRRPYFSWNRAEDKLGSVTYIEGREEKTVLGSIKGLLNNSGLYWLVRNRLTRSPAAAKFLIQIGLMSDFSALYNIYKTDYSSDLEEGWAVTLALLKQLRSEAGKRKARLVVVLVPSYVQVSTDMWHLARDTYFEGIEGADPFKPDAILQQFLIEEHIPYVHLLPRFQEQPSDVKERLYLAQDGHWDVEGHLLVSQLIHDFLTSRQVGLLR